MKLNIQAACDHAGLEISFHREAAPAHRLRIRERLDSLTRFPSAHTHSTRTTTHTAHTHERAQSWKFRRTAWRQSQRLQCALLSFSCRPKATAPAALKFGMLVRHDLAPAIERQEADEVLRVGLISNSISVVPVMLMQCNR